MEPGACLESGSLGTWARHCHDNFQPAYLYGSIEVPYTHITLMKAHILPNSDAFDIISKCF